MKTKNTFLIAYILLLLTALGCSKSTTNNPLSLKIGDKYQGGTIVYILDAGDAGYDEKVQHGLIASPENLGPAIYSNCGNLINGADATSIGSGKQNTLDIIASCNSASIAAKLCDDYSVIENGKTYDDWYLPSKLELIKVYEQKD